MDTGSSKITAVSSLPHRLNAAAWEKAFSVVPAIGSTFPICTAGTPRLHVSLSCLLTCFFELQLLRV